MTTPAHAQTPTPRCSAVVGLQWGDEGKGKVIDLITPAFDAVVRYNGGANAGHSVVINGVRHALHLIPSGVFHAGKRAIIGNGVVVDPEALLKEIDGLTAKGIDVSGIRLSDRAHVVLPWHKAEDETRETFLVRRLSEPTPPEQAVGSESRRTEESPRTESEAIGTTKRGIGPAYSDKAARSTSIRVGDLLRPEVLRRKIDTAWRFKKPTLAALGYDVSQVDPQRVCETALAAGERLRPMITDTLYELHDLLRSGRSLLFEGANATLLDVDHGTYPFVTSSSCSVLGIPSGTGVPGKHVTDVIGVFKAYCTRVGGGPFPTEQANETGHYIRERGREYGTTTGRPRRVGWLDLVALRYAVMLNGVSRLALMLLDVPAGFPELKVCVGYDIDGKRSERFTPDAETLAMVKPVYETLAGFEDIVHARDRDDLPKACQAYIEFIERFVGAQVGIISVGPDRSQTMVRGG
ncbi:MAG: adenylosuccinate synthase [Phycisphaerales bacterium]